MVEVYAKNEKLREVVKLVAVVGYIDVKKSSDREEIFEIEKMHKLFKNYNLHGQVQWIVAQTNRARNGELYRYIADTRGPAEIFEHGISGFHIDPYHPDQAASLLVDFFLQAKEDIRAQKMALVLQEGPLQTSRDFSSR
ncbi:hypothetical protein G4B88_009462 [Cannabis sativa]|uniref:sucrose synthase n=1 Tax=Cannabis sativa TaxID=3483 RepID=A0A7J6DS99_CANSA|nr:hypothetical protein G4B88_009462 [Cannabis sativa]